MMGKSRSHTAQAHTQEAGPGSHGRRTKCDRNKTVPLKALLTNLDIQWFSCSSLDFLKSRTEEGRTSLCCLKVESSGFIGSDYLKVSWDFD